MDPLQLLILSCALQAAGNVVQKQRVAARVPDVPLGQVARRLGDFFGALVRDPGWLLGMGLLLAGAIVGLQALAVMDLSLIKSLGRLETVFVILGGVIVLGERLRSLESVGVLLLLSGGVLLAMSAGETSGAATTRGAHLALVACVAGGLALFGLLQRVRPEPVRPELALAAAAGVLFGTGDILTKGATEAVKSLVGGFNVAESASLEGLVQTPEFVLALTAYVGGMILIQAAFSVGRVSVIGPVTLIGSMLLPIAFALTVLREDSSGDRLFGIAMVALGTVLLCRGAQPAARPTAPRFGVSHTEGRRR